MLISAKFFSIDNIISGVITGLINGALAISHIAPGELIAITVDEISTPHKTVFGESVITAFILGVVSTLITSKVFSKKIIKSHPSLISLVSRPIFPDILSIALHNAVFMFGCFVIAALLWQRLLGSIAIERFYGGVLIGLLAAFITMAVSFLTEKKLLKN